MPATSDSRAPPLSRQQLQPHRPNANANSRQQLFSRYFWKHLCTEAVAVASGSNSTYQPLGDVPDMLDKHLKFSLRRYWPVLLVQLSATICSRNRLCQRLQINLEKRVQRPAFQAEPFGLTSNNLRVSDGFRLSSNRIRKIQKVTASDYDSSMNVNNRVAG